MFSFTVYADDEIAYLYCEPKPPYPIMFSHESKGVVCDVDAHGNLIGIELVGGELHLADILASYPNTNAAVDTTMWRESSSMIDPIDVPRLIKRLALAGPTARLTIEFGRPCLLNFLVPRALPDLE